LVALGALFVWRPWKTSQGVDAKSPAVAPPVQRDAAKAARLADNAWSLNDAGETDRAIEECRRALEFDDRCMGALLCLANAYIKKREFVLAIADLNRAAKIEPENHMPEVDLAWAFNQQGDFDNAFAHADRAVKLKPDSGEAYYQRGSARQLKRAYREAIADFTEAIRHQSDFVWAYRHRAAAYKAIGEDALAQKDTAKADQLEGGQGKDRP
jgi:tetratricopeptide (TPR) repeat protein